MKKIRLVWTNPSAPEPSEKRFPASALFGSDEETLRVIKNYLSRLYQSMRAGPDVLPENLLALSAIESLTGPMARSLKLELSQIVYLTENTRVSEAAAKKLAEIGILCDL